MKLEFRNHCLCVTREDNDPKYYGTLNAAGESKLLHAIKTELNKQGYNLVKKRMWKDGHLVDDMQQYLKTKVPGNPHGDIYIYSGFWASRGANEDFNNGEVILNVEYDIYNKVKTA